jgi:hypothetical protein
LGTLTGGWPGIPAISRLRSATVGLDGNGRSAFAVLTCFEETKEETTVGNGARFVRGLSEPAALKQLNDRIDLAEELILPGL